MLLLQYDDIRYRYAIDHRIICAIFLTAPQNNKTTLKDKYFFSAFTFFVFQFSVRGMRPTGQIRARTGRIATSSGQRRKCRPHAAGNDGVLRLHLIRLRVAKLGRETGAVAVGGAGGFMCRGHLQSSAAARPNINFIVYATAAAPRDYSRLIYRRRAIRRPFGPFRPRPAPVLVYYAYVTAVIYYRRAF